MPFMPTTCRDPAQRNVTRWTQIQPLRLPPGRLLDVLLFETNPNRPPQPPSPHPPLWRAANPGKPGGGAAAGERSWAGARVPEVSWHVAPPKVPVWLLWLVHWHSVRACISGPSSSSKPLDSVPSHARNSTGRCRIPSPPTRHAAHQTGQTHAGGPKVPSGHAWIPVRHAQRRIDTRCWWPLDGVCVGLLRRSDMFPPGRSEPAVSSMNVQGMAQCFVVYA